MKSSCHIFIVALCVQCVYPKGLSVNVPNSNTVNVTNDLSSGSAVINNSNSLNIKNHNNVDNEQIHLPTENDDFYKIQEDVLPGFDLINNEVYKIRGMFGGYYRSDYEGSLHYIHGKYQAPTTYYYENYHHRRSDNSSLGYYLGYALRNSINHTEYNFHHHQYNENRVRPQRIIQSDALIDCSGFPYSFCPENTEPICLNNGTIYCASRTYFISPCETDRLISCVNTTVPCIRGRNTSICNRNFLENISMPCLGNTTIVDVNEDKYGNTLTAVSGTFIIVPALKIVDRTYCVSIIAAPSNQNEDHSTNVKLV